MPGDDDKKKSSAPAIGSPSPNLPPAVTMQPMMPGFQNMLAEQLAGGFGGQAGAPDFMAMLSQMYSPFKMVGPTTTTSTSTSKSSSGSGDRPSRGMSREEFREKYPQYGTRRT